jgi:diguanylate cyclase (GGDEF)-like protein/PAS domain S-box-containing protein
MGAEIPFAFIRPKPGRTRMGKLGASNTSHEAARSWTPAQPPPTEALRLRALQALSVLDSAAEPEFDALVRAAAHICGTPISLVSVVDAHRQWFKANLGLPGVQETPRDLAFCSHAILEEELFLVPDALQDARFAGNPLVVGAPGIRFYAGAPIRLKGGAAIGTLCVIDRQPRQLEASQRDALTCLAQAAARALEGRLATLELRQRNALLGATLSAIADAVLTADAQGRMTGLNPAAERLLGIGAAEATGQPMKDFVGLRSSQLEAGLATVLANVAAGNTVRLPADATLQRDGVASFAVEGSAAPLGLQGSVLVLRDVTSAREALVEMAHRATHDALTGLVNREEFDRQLKQRLLAMPTPCDVPADCLLYIDLDHFKIVNDSCGHEFGDLLLQKMAGLLRESVRATDLVARLGGDEFAILLNACPLAVAQKLAQNICNRLEVLRFESQGKRFQIGASIGLAALGGTLNDPQVLIRAADECCYAAKSAGRNRVVVWPAADQSALAAGSASQWAERIGRALDEDRFVLLGQLVMPLHAAAGAVKVEMLLRMLDDSGGLVPPGRFMPAAERFHLMGRIDRWVLRRTLDWMGVKLASCRAQQVGINLSGQSVGDPSFQAWAIATLETAGPALCRALTLEITETVAIASLDQARTFLRQIRSLGVSVALDDFGSGAATFGYLKQLPLDYLKIDGQFVRDLLTDPLDVVSVRSFVDVARVMGIKTIAEFVESAEVMERLRELGVDFAQGYCLHKPAALETLCLQAPEVRAVPDRLRPSADSGRRPKPKGPKRAAPRAHPDLH